MESFPARANTGTKPFAQLVDVWTCSVIRMHLRRTALLRPCPQKSTRSVSSAEACKLGSFRDRYTCFLSLWYMRSLSANSPGGTVTVVTSLTYICYACIKGSYVGSVKRASSYRWVTFPSLSIGEWRSVCNQVISQALREELLSCAPTTG